jgi:hypothetical protein
MRLKMAEERITLNLHTAMAIILENVLFIQTDHMSQYTKMIPTEFFKDIDNEDKEKLRTLNRKFIDNIHNIEVFIEKDIKFTIRKSKKTIKTIETPPEFLFNKPMQRIVHAVLFVLEYIKRGVFNDYSYINVKN